MGLMRWLFGLFGWGGAPSSSTSDRDNIPAMDADSPPREPRRQDQRSSPRRDAQQRQKRAPRKRICLTKTRRRLQRVARRRADSYSEIPEDHAYLYARWGSQTGHYLDLSRDANLQQLSRYGLPIFHTPEQLSDWTGVPLNRLAWLIHRFSEGRPVSVKEAHYHFRWLKKRSSGWRLIEAPKATLKSLQHKILREILDKVPVHSSAHGFAAGRSILTNAQPHAGQEVLLKFDLSNFYTTVCFARVVAIFRRLGYSREAAIWLASLTTSCVPYNLGFQEQGPYAVGNYLTRHLPQGAPTSPALANLSAFGLDVRLTGLANSFGATYTRYADDLTFSGSSEFGHGLRTFIPLVQQIIRQEWFTLNYAKRKVLRAHQRQIVTGVVVNDKPNINRREFDLLKAILTNCQRHGPSTQNRKDVADFYHHLQGRIAHVSMLNPDRGQQLLELFGRIDWTK